MEAKETVLVVAVGLEDEADLVVEAAASVEEGVLVEIRLVEAVSAEIAITLGMMMVPGLSVAAVDLEASVITSLAGAGEVLLVAMTMRGRRSSSR